MKIGGLQKLTLLDFPDKVSCTIFTCGCNFRCPFCHNASLIPMVTTSPLAKHEIIDFLTSRKTLLDGVCISGGEPLLQPDIETFIKEIKSLGYLVKLDTNGSMPDKLRQLADARLVDYVAMDIKNSIEKYGLTIGIENYDTLAIQESANFLMAGTVDYEFRTTVVKEFHHQKDFEVIGRWLKGARKYYLQAFEDSENVLKAGLHAPDDEFLKDIPRLLEANIETVAIRNK